ncbi:LAME_0E01530g1_1 [Lachancea meyersii CBS 8951]|uniref:LAME_0E01530g1_1 n=1 Tax=Lachancea meyersii CBS 8951 TaxID=1266667 RepID=A0A1G4JF80_9SACH|nr:LAME_0E01530g1_1 [Lachancea meyersii CBS 8951]
MSTNTTFPLHEACREGDISKVRELVDEEPKLVLAKDLDSRYPVHWAVSYQHENIVDFLLSRMQKVDLDDLVDESGWSVLHIASSVGNLGILVKLVNHSIKPDANLATSQGTTALNLACSKKQVSIAKFLIQEGASVRLKDSRNQLPLHRAASVGSMPMVDLLCKNKSPVNTKDINGWTPLFHALSEGHGDVAVALVQSYAAEYRDQRDVDNKSPLDVVADEKVKAFFLQNVE